MEAKYVILGVVGTLLILNIIVIILGFAVEKSYEGFRFIAKILEIDNNSILVMGTDDNDLYYRSEFMINLDKDTELVEGGKNIKFDDLGDDMLVEIIHTGKVQEFYPAFIDGKILAVIVKDRVL